MLLGGRSLGSGRLAAGRDAALSAVEGSVKALTRTMDLRPDGTDVQTVEYARAIVAAGRDLTVNAGGDVTIRAAEVTAGGALTLGAGGAVTVGANALTDIKTFSSAKTHDHIQAVSHVGSLLRAGGALSLSAGGDLSIAGSLLTAGGSAALSAGHSLTVASVVDQYFAEGWMRKSNSSASGEIQRLTHLGSTIEAGGAVALSAGRDLTLLASGVSAGGDLALTATDGAVGLLAGRNVDFEHHTYSRSNAVWQVMSDSGHDGVTATMTTLQADGELTVQAAEGVAVQVAVAPGQSLGQAVTALAGQPGTEWVGQLAARDDVAWAGVQEAWRQWDYKASGLSGPAAAVIAIAVAVATQGMGAALVGAGAGAAGGAAAGAAGAAAGTAGAAAVAGTTSTLATMGAAMANAGFTALVTQATLSLINNQGDLGKVLSDLGSSASLRAIATSILAAGLTAGALGELGLPAKPEDMTFADKVIEAGTQAGVGTAVDSTVGGQDFGEAFKRNLTGAAVGVLGAQVAGEIGEAYQDAKANGIDPLEYGLHKAVHAALGCGMAAASGSDCGAGAVGGAVGAVVTEAFYFYCVINAALGVGLL